MRGAGDADDSARADQVPGLVLGARPKVPCVSVGPCCDDVGAAALRDRVRAGVAGSSLRSRRRRRPPGCRGPARQRASAAGSRGIRQHRDTRTQTHRRWLARAPSPSQKQDVTLREGGRLVTEAERGVRIGREPSGSPPSAMRRTSLRPRASGRSSRPPRRFETTRPVPGHKSPIGVSCLAPRRRDRLGRGGSCWAFGRGRGTPCGSRRGRGGGLGRASSTPAKVGRPLGGVAEEHAEAPRRPRRT